jgi:hypothetical protein
MHPLPPASPDVPIIVDTHGVKLRKSSSDEYSYWVGPGLEKLATPKNRGKTVDAD